MMNMGMQPNQMLMQKLMQLRQRGQQSQGGMMPQGGGNPNPQMPQMGGNMLPPQNPNNPMQQGGMQSMAPQDPMMARKLMMMRMQNSMGANNPANNQGGNPIGMMSSGGMRPGAQ